MRTHELMVKRKPFPVSRMKSPVRIEPCAGCWTAPTDKSENESSGKGRANHASAARRAVRHAGSARVISECEVVRAASGTQAMPRNIEYRHSCAGARATFAERVLSALSQASCSDASNSQIRVAPAPSGTQQPKKTAKIKYAHFIDRNE